MAFLIISSGRCTAKHPSSFAISGLFVTVLPRCFHFTHSEMLYCALSVLFCYSDIFLHPGYETPIFTLIFFPSTFTSTTLISFLAIKTGSVTFLMYVCTHHQHRPAAEVSHSLQFKMLMVCWTSLTRCIYFFHGSTDPSGPALPHCRGFEITLRRTTKFGRTPLDE